MVSALTALASLIVPECWRSAAVTDLCGERGFALVWSAKGAALSLSLSLDVSAHFPVKLGLVPC